MNETPRSPLVEGQQTVSYQQAGDTTQPMPPAPLPGGDLPAIPGFEVRAVLGRGGMGVVYQAWQISLKRHVALKMILAGEHAEAKQLARFRTEAQAAARLQHPNIVQIYEIGEHQGRPFLCLEFIDGGSLSGRLNRQPQSAQGSARLVEMLARAMHYTHLRGIVHRDLKPANILLATQGETPVLPTPDHWLLTAIPKISDFGLAKQLQDDAGQTLSGAVLGTPCYMAPEQASGGTRDVGPLADVYALGVILYQMVTGELPFHADSQVETLRQVMQDEPIPPSKLRANVPRDLETICLKAMAKEPGRRYPSALSLALDLERFSAGEPILARREGLARKLWRKVRRHRALSTAVLLFALVMLGAGGWFWNWAQWNARIAMLTSKIDAALDAPHLTEDFLTGAEADLAALESLDPQKAENARGRFHQRFNDSLELELRKAKLPTSDIARLDILVEQFALHAPSLAAPLREKLLRRKQGYDPHFAMEGDGPKRLVHFEPGRVELHGGVVVPIASADHGEPVQINSAAANYDQLIATFDENWQDAPSIGLILNFVRRHGREITALQFAADGKDLASASSASIGRSGRVKVWDATGRDRFTHLVDKIGAVSLAYFPDNSYLAVACDGDPAVYLLDPKTGEIRHQFVAHAGAGVGCLAVSRDSQTLATGSGVNGKTGEVRLWDTKSWQLRQTLTGFRTLVKRVALSGNGQFLAAADLSRIVKIWDLAANEEKQSGRPFLWEGVCNSLYFTADSKRLFTPANFHQKPGTLMFPIYQWDAASNQCTEFDAGIPSSALSAMALSPDDQWMASASTWNGSLILREMQSGRQRAIHKETLSNWCTSLAFSPDGQRLATGGVDGAIHVRHVPDGQLLSSWETQGYSFSIRPGKGAGQNSFKNARAQKARFTLAIARNGQVLSEQTVADLPAGPLRLTARRDSHRLFFQVNFLPPLEFEEVIPLPSDGVFALSWPKGAGLTSLQALRRQPAQTDLLERGDTLFAQLKFAEALAVYQEQMLTVGSAEKEIAQEARLKSALSLLKLQRVGDALVELESLAGEAQKNRRWSAVALLELLQVYLEQGRSQEIEPLVDRLTGVYSFKDIRLLVSKECREKLLQFYAADAAGAQVALRPRAFDLRHLQRGAKMYHYFEVPKIDQLQQHRYVLRAHQFHGQLALALQTAEEILADKEYWSSPPDPAAQAEVVEQISSILREQGHAELAQERIARFLENKPDVAKLYPPLLVERAAVHIALKHWDQAQEDLDAYLRCEPNSYSLHVQVCLARGFLRERKGDAVAALEAWKQGLLQNYQKLQALFAKNSDSPLPRRAPGLTSLRAIDSIHGTIVASLADDLSTEEADAVLNHVLGRVGSEKTAMSLLNDRITMPAGIMRDMWRSPRGRESARKLAFRQLSLAESTRLPIMVLGAEYVTKNAMPANMTAEQEQIGWMMGEQIYLAYMEDKLQAPQLLGLSMTWKGSTNFLGWGSVSSTLEPALRGPLAYVLGHRFELRLKQPTAALVFFQTAVRDAPPDSALKRLAQAEVERLQKMNPK